MMDQPARLKHQVDALEGLADLIEMERQSTVAAASVRTCRALERAEDAMRKAVSLLRRDIGRTPKAKRREPPARTPDNLPLCWKYTQLACPAACQHVEVMDVCFNDPV